MLADKLTKKEKFLDFQTQKPNHQYEEFNRNIVGAGHICTIQRKWWKIYDVIRMWTSAGSKQLANNSANQPQG